MKLKVLVKLQVEYVNEFISLKQSYNINSKDITFTFLVFEDSFPKVASKNISYTTFSPTVFPLSIQWGLYFSSLMSLNVLYDCSDQYNVTEKMSKT